MALSRLRFGAFIAPFQAPNENPSLAIERDLELVEWMERLGYDEVWFGEHHSGGWEIGASPEIMIAIASQRTKRIRLGAGVSSLPYHHPFILADRIRMLDHLTRGRVMFGVGPGSLPSDAYMQGIETAKVRDMMDESLEVLVRLLRGETVTAKTSWFTLQEARLQLLSYDSNGVDIAVANQVSPTGARAAGKLGLSLLSIGATSTGAFNALASNWAIAEQLARDHGTEVNRSGWRLVGPMHCAESREQARKDVMWGLPRWMDYFRNVAALPLAPEGADPIDAMVDSGFAVIGTPDECVAQIRRMQEQSGGFGCFLKLAVNWADWEQTKRSYELFARHVIPVVNGTNVNRSASETWLRTNRDKFVGEMRSAVVDRIAKHEAEKGKENIQPGVVDYFTKPK